MVNFCFSFFLQNMNHGSCIKSVFTVPSDRGKKKKYCSLCNN